jgi:hypothetical protein
VCGVGMCVQCMYVLSVYECCCGVVLCGIVVVMCMCGHMNGFSVCVLGVGVGCVFCVCVVW